MNRLCPLVIAAAIVALVACNALRRRPVPVSNDRCHVCHINYADEKLAVTHAAHGVGCEACHGPSDPHCGDEIHHTPPDTMYAHAAVPAACMKCHPAGKLGHAEMHNLNLVVTPKPKKICTECHGTHRLEQRIVRWDKVTRKLLTP